MIKEKKFLTPHEERESLLLVLDGTFGTIIQFVDAFKNRIKYFIDNPELKDFALGKIARRRCDVFVALQRARINVLLGVEIEGTMRSDMYGYKMIDFTEAESIALKQALLRPPGDVLRPFDSTEVTWFVKYAILNTIICLREVENSEDKIKTLEAIKKLFEGLKNEEQLKFFRGMIHFGSNK